MSHSLGALFGQLSNSITNAIDRAAQSVKNAGVELEIAAGRQLSLAVENAKNVYESELNKTIDKVSTKAKATFDGLNSMVQQFEQATGAKLSEIEQQALVISNNLPFAKHMPQLIDVTPAYIVIDELANHTLIMFKGNFYWSASKGYEPSLSFNGQPGKLVDSKTDCLTFLVSQAVFSQANPNQYSYQTGDLIVPWNDGWILNHKVQCLYKVGISALPRIAGTGTVTYLSHQTKRLENPRTSGPVAYNGNEWYGKETWHTAWQYCYPTPGCQIDISRTPVLTVNRQHGDGSRLSAQIVSTSYNEITVKVIVYCGSGHDMGIGTVKVDFFEFKDVPSNNTRQDSFALNWKDSQLLQPHPEETISNVVFDDYHGVHSEYSQPELGQVLQISADLNGIWKIWAKPPQNLLLTGEKLSASVREKVETVRTMTLLNKHITP